jgi:transposase, IS5 family
MEGRINNIDVTWIEVAQFLSVKGKDGKFERDPDGNWHVKTGSHDILKSTYGYLVHMDIDEYGFIQLKAVKARNMRYNFEHDTLLLGDDTALYSDTVYSSKETRKKQERFGISDQQQRKGFPQAGSALHA